MCITLPAYQDSYRKVDVITKEEFDSQRGVEDQRAEDAGDTELVFSLDLQEPSAAVAPPTSAKPPVEVTTKQPHKEERPIERARETSPAKGSSGGGGGHSRRGRWEKRARFYPVPVKQESPSKVCPCPTPWLYVWMLRWSYIMPLYPSSGVQMWISFSSTINGAKVDLLQVLPCVFGTHLPLCYRDWLIRQNTRRPQPALLECWLSEGV